MPYERAIVQQFIDEVIRFGVRELRTPEDVDNAVKQGSALIFINSVCGCAAGVARPGLGIAMKHKNKPDQITTVFAGCDVEATARARNYFTGFPPSSPCFGLLKDGKLVQIIQRHEIEGQTPETIASMLTSAFDKHCS